MVVQGELGFFVNGKTFVRKQGESVDIPSGTLHTFSNKTDAACAWVNIHSPKGSYKFFEAFGVPETEDNAIMKSVEPEIIQKALATASQYDTAIPRPPKQ